MPNSVACLARSRPPLYRARRVRRRCARPDLPNCHAERRVLVNRAKTVVFA
jgi:hypothetical protein